MAGIMLNEDDTHFFLSRQRDGHQVGIDDIEEFVDQYAGTQVTEFVLCVGGRLADFDSRVKQSFAAKHEQRIENGRAVDYADHPLTVAPYALQQQGIDWLAVAFDRFRTHGISPWASIRMNDCHDNDQPTSVLHPDYFHDHPELRRVTHHAPTAYFDRCYDYAQPAIFQQMIDFVEEVALRYDVDGIELDWMRESYCFRIGHEHAGAAIITRFLRDVRAITARAAEQWGHPVKVGVRVMADPIASVANGFDVITWVREGLVDVVVPTARWRTSDNDMPIAFWKQLLGDHPVVLGAGLEILLSPWRLPFPDHRLREQTVETTQGAAANYLGQGADRIYLFNYMDRAELFSDALTHVGRADHYAQVLRTIGDEGVYATPRRHVVTFRDIGPEFAPPSDRLPAPLRAGSFQQVRVGVGVLPAGAPVQVVLGPCDTDGGAVDPSELVVFVNSEPVRLVGTETLDPPYVDVPCAVFTLDNPGDLPPFLVVEVSTTAAEPQELRYVEVRVN